MEVTKELLNYYKDLYNGHKIIYVRFLNNDFIFKTLTKQEYKIIYNSYVNKIDVQNAICNIACVYPEEYNFDECGYAGLPEYVSDVIEDLSGFKDIHTVINFYNTYKNQVTLEIQAMDLIKAFIPEYTYEEMESWTWEKLMKITVRAEQIAKLKGFDWHLEDQSDKYEEDISKINSDNKDFINELYQSGIDPMFYFEDEIKQLSKKNVLDFPLITSGKWNDEDLLDVIRKQSVIS